MALISKTHLTDKSYLKIYGYTVYTTIHLSHQAHGEILLITIKYNNKELNIATVYCSPRHISKVTDLRKYLLIKLGLRFIIGRDFNAKHTEWRSQLTIPKDWELLMALDTCKCNYISRAKLYRGYM